MAKGYDQFFKAAKQNAAQGRPEDRSRTGFPPARGTTAATNLGSKKSTNPEDLTQALRERLKLNKPRQRARKKISWKLAGLGFLSLAFFAFGFFEYEKVERWIQKVEIKILGSALANQTGEKAKASSSATKAQGNAGAAVVPTEGQTVAQNLVGKEPSAEDMNHFRRLNERKRELDAREEELSRLEAEILAQKKVLEKRLENLEQTRRGISNVLEDRIKVDEQKVETLVQMYSNMKPQQAASVFEKMDEDLAVEILGRMKKKNAAEIMNLLKSEKAQVFSEKYAGYQRKTASMGNAKQNNSTKEGGNDN